MKHYNSMNHIRIVPMLAVLLLVTATAAAQRKNKQTKDNATALQEFARLGKWNTRRPVQINLHITHHVTPTVAASDSADTDMTLYYDIHAFYMQAEGLEQIANDSILIMVNNPARMIRVYPNTGLLNNKQGNNITSFVPDTSLEKLSKQFLATIQEDARNKRVILQSRDKINGTGLEKEVIEVSYNPGNYQPHQYKQTRRSVLPIDSALYSELSKDVAWKGRLITANVKTGQLFFVVKEQVTECLFTGIDFVQRSSPVSEHNRVVKTPEGEYLPAKGYEAYNVSQE